MHLTVDGTSIGMPCRVDVSGLVPLRPQFRRTVITAIEGPPAVQLFDNLVGEQLTMTIFVLMADEYEDLIEIIDTADAGTGVINIKLTDGDLGEFDLDCVLENIDQPGQFMNGRIPSLSLAFRIHTVNEPEEEPEP